MIREHKMTDDHNDIARVGACVRADVWMYE